MLLARGGIAVLEHDDPGQGPGRRTRQIDITGPGESDDRAGAGKVKSYAVALEE